MNVIKNMSREEIAQRELGHTDVHPVLARVLVVVFVTTIVSVLALEYAGSLAGSTVREDGGRWPHHHEVVNILDDGLVALRTGEGDAFPRLFDANRAMLARIDRFEQDLDDASMLGRWLQPRVQHVLCRFAGVGSEQVYLGHDGWLFFRSAIEHLTGEGFLEPARLARRSASGSEWQLAPQPDPRPAIIDFHYQLKQMGIRLIVVPVSVKASVHAEKLIRAAGPEAIHNPSFQNFVAELEDRGVTVFDPTESLESVRDAGGAAFLATDTHWSNAGLDRVASDLADVADRFLAPADEVRQHFHTKRETISNLGDLSRMLRLPKHDRLYAAERELVDKVIDDRGETWTPRQGAPVLLLGDSFTNIFSLASMGWGEGAGFAPALSRHLGRPVDTITRNDDGAYATRQDLARRLAQNPSALAGTQLVIWEFTARELSFGDWRLISLEPDTPSDTSFFVPPAGASVQVTGRIAAIGEIPDPMEAPYADHIVAVHLVDVRSDEPPMKGREALVMVQSMLDYELVRGAKYTVGEEVTLMLRPWSEVAPELGAINRSELYDEKLLAADPCWGTEPTP